LRGDEVIGYVTELVPHYLSTYLGTISILRIMT
jgi:hypothetical protein